jgi:hypothetical protein
MIERKKVLLCVAAAFGLSACEATESGTTTTQGNAFAFSNVNDGVSSFEALTNSAVAEPATAASGLPGGSATYDGIMTVILDNNTNDGVLGTIRLNVGFDSNSLSGSAGSFRNFSDEATGGSLSISNGLISPVGTAGGTAQVSGSIDFEAGPMAIDETYTHLFSGPDGQYNIGAALDGSAQPSIGLPIDIISSWTVERQ